MTTNHRPYIRSQQSIESVVYPRRIDTLFAILSNIKLSWRILHLHHFLRSHTELAWGSITEKDEVGVQFAVEAAKNYDGPIVEIGILFGHTTLLLSTLSPKQIISVENFSWNPFYLGHKEHRRFTTRTLRPLLKSGMARLFDGEADDFFRTHKQLEPSLVFIDTDHDYLSVHNAIKWAESIGCPVIAGHDFSKGHNGVLQAVDELADRGRDIQVFGSVWWAVV